ncbi:magnesium-translocating P-type ATPase [Hylemonella gracilis]|uniref:Magnesium-transporting ATPase, P-type 1 n=1 Tax=Hylemonella gracilis TaxID=80880 RepID=A0A4V1A2B0_9BURK|nr:magnesium-translocating P-type ATPase [Hylemonella gracilis]QBK05419.1 magnesium-translocating P-type ATPase [Hylemonella gracilis]
MTDPVTDATSAWWLRPPPAAAQGLSGAQADEALAKYGANAFRKGPRHLALTQLLARFRNPLILVLLAASVVSAATGDIANFLIILLMVTLSITLDFLQEHRAIHASDRLRESVALRAHVLRDGHPREIPVTALVPGDVVLLAAGDRVPADGFVVEARDFFVNQSLLTGESYPVEKHPGVLEREATELQQARNAVFMGSVVVSGSARILIMCTGSATVMGEMAHSLLVEPPPTAFALGMHRFGLLLMRITVMLVLFVMLVNLLLHRPVLDTFVFAVALAVGLTPEMLPMIVSVTLARGAMRMARQRVIVKRLASIQNLGAMDVLCTDKTGTLTEARIRLERCVDVNGNDTPHLRRLAYLNSIFESGVRSPLDDAILAGEVDVSGWRKVDEVPFDFERRRVSVLVERADTRCLVVKGAPEDVLALCSQQDDGEGRSSSLLNGSAREALQAQYQTLEREGLRVLGVAWRAVAADHTHADVSDEHELIFAGFCAFIDPPKVDAGTALHALARSGVDVKILTGDSERVTLHLCALLKLPVVGVLTGQEIAQMDEAALRARVGRTTLFCRVNPAQKNRVILACKAMGHVVGYLGDGVNDAPALLSADVSLTVDSAADVAREVADIVMLEHNLSVLHAGVQEGRRTFGNVMKYTMMGTSSNFGNMVSMAGASLFLPFLPMLPSQILLNNVLYDLAQTTIPLDLVDPSDLRRPRNWDMGFILRYMGLFGLISSAFDVLTFCILLWVFQADDGLFRTGWFMESLITQVLVIFVIRTRGKPWASRPSAALIASSLGVVALALLLPFTPLGRLFQFEQAPAVFFVWLLGMVVTYLALVELCKRFFYARWATVRSPGSAPQFR